LSKIALPLIDLLKNLNSSFTTLISISSFCVLFGRAYQYLFFGAPYTALLWDESLLSPIVEKLGGSWYLYSTNPKTSQYISVSILVSGLIFLTTSLTSLANIERKYFLMVKKSMLVVSIFLLLFFGICVVKDKNYDLSQFFELSAQFSGPLILLWIIKKKPIRYSWEFLLRIVIAATFVPHGLFAIGIPYVPGNFIDMSIKILRFTEDQSMNFLFTIGCLDLIFSCMLFVRKTAKIALIYCSIWGFITAFARLLFGIQEDFFWSSLHQCFAHFMYRIPNGLIPLIALLLLYNFFQPISKIKSNEI